MIPCCGLIKSMNLALELRRFTGLIVNRVFLPLVGVEEVFQAA